MSVALLRTSISNPIQWKSATRLFLSSEEICLNQFLASKYHCIGTNMYSANRNVISNKIPRSSSQKQASQSGVQILSLTDNSICDEVHVDTHRFRLQFYHTTSNSENVFHELDKKLKQEKQERRMRKMIEENEKKKNDGKGLKIGSYIILIFLSSVLIYKGWRKLDKESFKT